MEKEGFSQGELLVEHMNVRALQAAFGGPCLTYSTQQRRSPESYQAGSLCWTAP